MQEQNSHIFPLKFDQLIQYNYILDRTYKDLRSGKKSNSLNSPVIVSYVPFLDKYEIIDGNHRTLQKFFNGDSTVNVTQSEIFPVMTESESLIHPYSVVSEYHYKLETGGKVFGKSHAEGGEKFKIKGTGKILELEGDEGVINKNSMADPNVYKVEGTIEEIASCINEQNGGIKFSDSNKPCNIKTVMTDKQKEIRERRDKELEEKNKKWAEGKQKYREVFFVQGNYGSGWEDLTSHDIYGDAKDEKKVYDENESYPHRVITRKISRADYDSGKYSMGGKTPKYNKGGNTSEITTNDIPEILKHYKVAALWSSNEDESDKPLDFEYTIHDISDHASKRMNEDVTKFVTENIDALNKSGLSAEQIGHSLWLTQNRHGAGFFDFDMPDGVEKQLTKAAQDLGNIDLYVGDDGQIYGLQYAKGGKTPATKAPKKIEDQYKGLTPKQIWTKWSSQQKKHFLYDHKDFIAKILYKNVDIEKYSSKKFDQLPVFIKEALVFHTSDTQYGEGGKTPSIEELYWGDYYAWIGEHGQLGEASKDFDQQYKDAVKFYNREKKEKNLDEYGYIGINGTGNKFAIIYMTPGYSDNLKLQDFCCAKSYEAYMAAVDKYYKTKTFVKGNYEK